MVSFMVRILVKLAPVLLVVTTMGDNSVPQRVAGEMTPMRILTARVKEVCNMYIFFLSMQSFIGMMMMDFAELYQRFVFKNYLFLSKLKKIMKFFKSLMCGKIVEEVETCFNQQCMVKLLMIHTYDLRFLDSCLSLAVFVYP